MIVTLTPPQLKTLLAVAQAGLRSTPPPIPTAARLAFREHLHAAEGVLARANRKGNVTPFLSTEHIDVLLAVTRAGRRSAPPDPELLNALAGLDGALTLAFENSR